MCHICRQEPCHSGCEHADPDPYIECIWPGCGNRIRLGEEYFDDHSETVICMECLEDMPLTDLLELYGIKLDRLGETIWQKGQ